MPFGVLKNRKRVNLTLDNKFVAWLHSKNQETAIPISRIVEMATIEKYKEEYDNFYYKDGEENE